MNPDLMFVNFGFRVLSIFENSREYSSICSIDPLRMPRSQQVQAAILEESKPYRHQLTEVRKDLQMALDSARAGNLNPQIKFEMFVNILNPDARSSVAPGWCAG